MDGLLKEFVTEASESLAELDVALVKLECSATRRMASSRALVSRVLSLASRCFCRVAADRRR
jgi:hypothetical protein